MFIFTFSFKPETNEATYAGNIGIQEALNLLQNLAIADAVNKAREAERAGQQQTEEDKIEKEK